jgi:tRNA(Arg) A34 adenosine deaminase TadA
MTGDTRSAIESEVQLYLQRSEGWYERGTDEYFARIALEQALLASREGNYGIGAVAVDFRDGQVREFRERSAMITGLGVIDHAETRAVLAAYSGAPPNQVYQDSFARTDLPRPGVLSYGTLEPCPMCVCVLTNAAISRSISTVVDGHLVQDGDVVVSDGAASVLDKKFRLQPKVWQEIQRGLHLQFDQLSTLDSELVDLSWRIFAVSREEIDAVLARRRPFDVH